MSRGWLVLDLCGPMLAFGGVAIDQVGPTRSFPAASMLTGLLANALGWHWSDRDRHAALQERLIFAAAQTRGGDLVADTQNAKLDANDRGWTTRGAPDGREGGTYGAPHRRFREFLGDAHLVVAVRLSPEDATPSLDDLAGALDRPARPLFIGRKGCLPTRPIHRGCVSAGSAHDALLAAGCAGLRSQWPEGEGPEGDRRIDLPDIRNWRTGLHSGSRPVMEGRLMGTAP